MNFSRPAKLAAFSILAILGTACSGGNGISIPTAPAMVTTTTADPAGDANAAIGATAWDITQVVTSRLTTGATTLNVSVTFAQAISAANLPAGGSKLTDPLKLGVVVAFDTGASGLNEPVASCLGSPTFPNVAFFVDAGLFVGRRLNGNYPIIQAVGGTDTGQDATISFTGPNTITYSIPLSAIGGGSGALQLAVISANGALPFFTDCAPNNSYIST